MRHQKPDIRRYLLGDPSQNEEERSAIEEAYLKNTGSYEDLLEIEDDLVDEYVFGRLPEEEAALFQHSLNNSARWQKKVEIASALRKYATDPSRRDADRTFFRIPLRYSIAAACAACVLLVVAALTLYTVRTKQMANSSRSMAKTEQGPTLSTPLTQSTQVPVEQQRPLAPKVTPVPVLSFVLMPDLVRGNSEQTQIPLSSGRYIVQLRMQREDEPYRRYEATVSTPEGRNIAQQEDLMPTGSAGTRTVALDISSELLKPGVYILNLKGRTAPGQPADLDDYTFQVVKR